MINLVALSKVLAVGAAVSVGFASACWYSYNRAGVQGVVIIWLSATLVGVAFFASGIAAPRGVQDAAEFIEAVLLSSFVFGAGALIVIASLDQERGKAGNSPEKHDTRYPPLGLALRVSGAMPLALLLGLLVLAMSSHEL
jgi:hypothetical protein